MAEMTEKQLKGWESRQRKAYRDGALTKAQIKKLADAGFVFELPDTAAENKAKLLEMARNGEPRPHSIKSKIGRSLASYLNKGHDCYDPSFISELKKINESWFITIYDIANKKKKELIEMASRGESRPTLSHPLGVCFRNYTREKSECYDSEFVNNIKRLTTWLKTRFDDAIEKRKKLIEMAQKDLSRPSPKSILGRALNEYIKKGGSSYNQTFDRTLRECRPDWFNKSSFKKEQILNFAKEGKDKPPCRSSLGIALRNYIREEGSCFDKNFSDYIKRLRPDWFRERKYSSGLAKKELIALAKKGKKKPSAGRSLLGRKLCSYISPQKSTYDKVFVEKIQKLRPDWLLKPSQAKKNLLYSMAIAGEDKPTIRKHPLGWALRVYTRVESCGFDPVFNTEIRHMAPQWFNGKEEK